MNRQRFDENATGALPSLDHSLLCSNAGCNRRWTCDFGKRLCSECDARRHSGHAAKPPQRQAMLPAMPTLREAVRPYAEPDERDEEYVHGAD